jgi:MFS family permease
MQNSKVSPSSSASHSLYGYAVVGITFFIFFIVFAVHYSFGVFFTPVIEELGWSRAALSGAFSISWILQGVCAIFMGWLTDRLGPRIVLSVSGLLVGAGYLLLSQMTSVWELYLYYGVVIGFGLSGIVVPLMSTVARQFSVKRSMMTGIAATGVGVGVLVGPPVINRLVSISDWRTSYLILGGLITVTVVGISQWLRKSKEHKSQDSANNSEIQSVMHTGSNSYSLKQAIKTGQFWLVFIIFFCLAFCEYVVMVHIVPHAIDLGISPETAANILSIFGGTSIVGCLFLGGAADKIGVRLVYFIGFILMTACLFWLIIINSIVPFYIFAAIFGFGLGGMSASQSLVVASLFGIKSHGIIFGILNNGFSIGATITPFLAGYIFDVTRAYYPAFFISGSIGCVGLILTIWLKRPS